MKRFFLCITAICAGLAACTASIEPPPASPTSEPSPTFTPVPTPAGPFDYDSSVPFDTKIISETEREGVMVVDLNYAAHDPDFAPTTAGRTLAYLVKPKGEGPFAGMVYLHWLGSGKSTRAQFLDEAVLMAQRGAVCLLIQGYFPWMINPAGDERDRPRIRGQVIELRRGIDFLLAQPEVDPNRLGFVGHDYGATYGGVLAGVDDRLKAYVLVAGAPSFSGYAGLYIPHETYFPMIHDLDPTQFIPQAAPASIFFQFGAQDGSLSRDTDMEYYNSASEPKRLEWYDDIHDMSSQAVLQSRLGWLQRELEMTPPDTKTAGQVRFDEKGIEQVWVPAGSFQMGTDTPALKRSRLNSRPRPDLSWGNSPASSPSMKWN